MEKRNAKALLPIAVFVVLYLGLGMLFEYGLEIEMGLSLIHILIDRVGADLKAFEHVNYCHAVRKG